MWRNARRDCVVCASQDVLDEIENQLRLKFGFSPRYARLMTLFVERRTFAVKVVSAIHACRDTDDDRILAAALDGKCSHLVTGDSDLLALKRFEGVRIVTPREFLGLVSH